MVDPGTRRIESWLSAHEDRLDRFRSPIPIEVAATEIGVSPASLLAAVRGGTRPPVHVWSHLYRGQRAPSKPYCLRLTGPDTVGLDWEHSVTGAAEAAFRRRGYQTALELGEAHVVALTERPDLDACVPGVNQRDLWALRVEEPTIDLWIVEAKGKQASGFDYFGFAEALGQVFPLSAGVLGGLLGTKHAAGHGSCWRIAQRLMAAWTARGYRPSITLAVLVPYWAPDALWEDRRVRWIPAPYYERPVGAFRRFAAGGSAPPASAGKGPRLFWEGLAEVDATCDLRRLVGAGAGLRFRLLTAGADPDAGFVLGGV
jgi:hypothetical protein